MQRVIGVGGDRVACCTSVGAEARITVNGRPVREPYVYEGDADGVNRSYDVKVPEGRLFLLGDRRSDARDSRFFASDHGGTVPVDAVRGRVTDGRTGPALLGTALLAGGALVLTGGGLGIGFLVVPHRPGRRWCRRRPGRCGTAEAGRRTGRQWPAAWGFGPPGVALGSGPLAASASL
ncbi:signal peptidase I [Streptomyces eurythermus]|uniref:signal peptidase I n=1 Tax=Streptomyces eurythermus TaxID=42237 RepID=UPI0036FCC799